MKIDKYMIAYMGECEDIESIVNNLINQGWQPFGSPVLTTDGRLHQAMVVYDGVWPSDERDVTTGHTGFQDMDSHIDQRRQLAFNTERAINGESGLQHGDN